MLVPLTLGKVRNAVLSYAHPAGCEALIGAQLARLEKAIPTPLPDAEGKTAVVIGSTRFGYGSALLISLKRAGFSRVMGIGFEPPVEIKKVNEGLPTERVQVTSTSGCYITKALHERDPQQVTIFANAFADSTRDFVVNYLREKPVDLLIYSLATGFRDHLGKRWNAALKVIGDPLKATDIDFRTGQVKEIDVKPATELEIENTIRVMGGDDLNLWGSAFIHGGIFRRGAKIVALSYDGTELEPIRRMYKEGTMGSKQGAKAHINATVKSLDARLQAIDGEAYEAMFQPVVTQASVQIPGLVKYLSAYLGLAAGGVGVYEDPLQVAINFVNAMYGEGEPWKNIWDENRRLWFDQKEKDPILQSTLERIWETSSQPGEPGEILSRGFEIFRTHFLNLFGFEVDGVDYNEPVEVDPVLTQEMGVFNLLAT